MRQVEYTTIVEQRVNGKWEFFSQQATITGLETPKSDAEYLHLCQQISDTPVRLAPKQGFHVTASTVYNPSEL